MTKLNRCQNHRCRKFIESPATYCSFYCKTQHYAHIKRYSDEKDKLLRESKLPSDTGGKKVSHPRGEQNISQTFVLF